MSSAYPWIEKELLEQFIYPWNYLCSVTTWEWHPHYGLDRVGPEISGAHGENKGTLLILVLSIKAQYADRNQFISNILYIYIGELKFLN